MPRTPPNWRHGPTRLVVRAGYVLQHSSIDRIALWVCEGVHRDQLVGDAERLDRFAPDPELPVGQRAELSDYEGSGYNRGHVAPAGDQNREQRLNEETFYLSNIAPQVPAFNRGIWSRLEDAVRRWVLELADAKIVSGSFYFDPEEDDPAKADGLIRFEAIGSNSVAAPTHFYKLVVGQCPRGAWRALAFVMDNRRYEAPHTLADHLRAIDWLEERAGLDFMPDLTPEAEDLRRHDLAVRPGQSLMGNASTPTDGLRRRGICERVRHAGRPRRPGRMPPPRADDRSPRLAGRLAGGPPIP
jgi:endonuclease G